MLISENALNVLTACEYRGIGKGWVNRNLRGGESVATIVARIAEKDPLVTVAGFEARKAGIRGEIEALGAAIDGVVGLGDAEFPIIRESVTGRDRPIALFYRGDIGLIKTVADKVAVIGMLYPTAQIEEDERTVVRELVKRGKCIVSGLAHGCDTVGHRETLDCGGKTVAFLSSPLTQVNPPVNRPLAEEIVAKGGLLVSEYFRDVHSKREFVGRYAERDRLQAMFAESVVLAASYAQRDYGKDSGSRFAMGKAEEYRVPRYVIYDEARFGSDPMFNLSRDEMEHGAIVIRPSEVDASTVLKARVVSSQLDFGI